ncbi:MAG: multicopper oxidase domain-containing protein, partial [Chloroflexota bacterium]
MALQTKSNDFEMEPTQSEDNTVVHDAPEADTSQQTQTSAQPNGTGQNTLSRRSLLRGALAGSAAIGVASAGLLATNSQSVSQAASLGVQTSHDEPPTGEGAAAAGQQAKQKLVTRDWTQPFVWDARIRQSLPARLDIIYRDDDDSRVSSYNGQFMGYNAQALGPTLRTLGDQTFRVELVNSLPLNPGETNYPPGKDNPAYPNWCLPLHANTIQAIHTTNLHTHGLHVASDENLDGSRIEEPYSDNVFLTIPPQPDLDMQSNLENCEFAHSSHNNLQKSYAQYAFSLGNVGEKFLAENPDIAEQLGHEPGTIYPHRDGTAWYHPHIHGSTFTQVASGLVGLIIVEGDTDAALQDALDAEPDSPSKPTGPYHFREREMIIQRFVSGPRFSLPEPAAEVNGEQDPMGFTMQPGSVERWRILNGSVDGFASITLYVLKGEWQQITDPESKYKGQLADLHDEEHPKHPIKDSALPQYAVPYKLLAYDSVTLVNDPNHPYPAPVAGGDMSVVRNTFQTIDIASGDNPVHLGAANRADLLFQAPREPGTYTIIARHNVGPFDDSALKVSNVDGVQNIDTKVSPLAHDTIVGYITIESDNDSGESDTNAAKSDTNAAKSGTNAAKSDTNAAEPSAALVPDVDPFPIIFEELGKRPVQPYLHPIIPDELKLTQAEKTNRQLGNGDYYRKRRFIYSGWGGRDYPKAEQLAPGYEVRPIKTRTFNSMAVDGRKFLHSDIMHAMNVDTAEEWVVENHSMVLYGERDDSGVKTNIDPKVWQQYPEDIEFQTSREPFKHEDSGLYPVAGGTDHPFHIHQNPFWVTERWLVSEVDSSTGEVTLTKDPDWIPRWQDVIEIPRDGGRIVARSRLWDFTGNLVNHCHLLKHEDNGMMERVKIIRENSDNDPYLANYHPDPQLANREDSSSDTWSSSEESWAPVPSRETCFLQNQAAYEWDWSEAEGGLFLLNDVPEGFVLPEPAYVDDGHSEDDHGEDEHSEDEHSEDEHSEDEHSEDEHSEDEHSEDEHSEDEQGEDEQG